MIEVKIKRTYESQPNFQVKTRLEQSKIPAIDKVTPEVYARLTAKQREELVSKLIDFLKTF